MCSFKRTVKIVTIRGTKVTVMPNSFYNDKVALEKSMYKKVFHRTFKSQGNLPWKRGIMKIIHSQNTERTVLRRMFISGQFFNITQQDIGLTVMSQSILQVANTADLTFK